MTCSTMKKCARPIWESRAFDTFSCSNVKAMPSLLDKYLPRYQFSERHALSMTVAPAAAIAAAHAYRPESDPFFRRMIALRGLPARALNRLRQNKTPVAPFGLDNFTLLELAEGRELVYGLAGQFWKLNFGQVPLTNGADFLACDHPGTARLVLGFKAKKQGDARTRLTTETRVFCQDQDALRRFTPYWYLIRPVSGLIRQRILQGIRSSALQTPSS